MRRLEVVPVLLLAAGCSSSDNPERLRDTTGMQVGWACDEVPCQVEIIAESYVPPCEPAESPGYGQSFGRFFSLWSTCGPSAWSTFEERIVACNASADCPNLDYYEVPSSFECVAGLCQNVDTAGFQRDRLSRFQVELLCYGATPRSETTSPFDPEVEQVETLVGQSCPSTENCAVPPECLQP